MGVLSELEPKSVFGYFEEITRIPHGSGNVDRISDYLVEFAKKQGLFYRQDELKNVILVKEATPGYEEKPAVILQGHMDMVAVKKPGCEIDLEKEGLRVAVEGDRVYAEGTSLGGDDGIAVAYALALLSSDTLKHPKLEVILTVDEEVGMDGARGIDLSGLTGHRMINLDSEEEGIFLTSCAGGARVKCRIPVAESPAEGLTYRVTVDGLLGGHSGGEIHKERGNSNCLFGRLLYRLCQRMPVRLAELQGGLADNAIPRETTGLLVIRKEDSESFGALLDTVEKELQGELSGKDPGLRIRAVEEEGKTTCISAEDTLRTAAFLWSLPNGVQAMSADMPGLVETSLNLGILQYKDGTVCAEFSVRSSVESAKKALIRKLQAVTGLAGGEAEVSGDYPGWRFRKDSPLREKMVALYEEMYGEKPRVEAIHAGLECGILGSKIEDLDCVSMGPDMRDIHTTEETLSISSVRRVWEYLVRLLESV
ncbi:MAG: aminoacyl-histidine dipeptidase [Roseburia sp.]|nr:aminoacyl-histidine dipeptidase [Roseburia sp.]MCM1098714.1 aminoacyl-histidine dipeptidase [Ruminococcus flavefaciens]